jgi:assimilatory nitrate reductase catalytic subunit
MNAIPGPMSVKTTCPYCGVGCGVLAKRGPNRTATIQGDPHHPSNFGHLCSKGAALAETIGLEGRLLHPEIGGRKETWDQALDLVATRFSEAIAAHGPDSVAFYVSGQILTEDYYVANKLMKGFIGSANIDTNSRLCMASAVAGHRRAFGADTVPGTYRDLELADLVVLVGSNLAWCHPVLYQRLAAAKSARPDMRIVVIDPRRTVTAEIADLHLPIRADGDVALFTGLLSHLAKQGRIDRDYVEAHTAGLEAALIAASALRREDVEQQTGLDAKALASFYRLFGETEKVVTVYSQGVNQSSRGTDKVNAIVNCHLAAGRIGRPGMGPFSVTGQPNAMGGREVGGLANMLAAHMDIDNAADRARVQRFWHAPAVAAKPGLKAIDLFHAVRKGRIKALWIIGTNPADSMPEADLVEQALRTCPFVVVSDVMRDTDTARHARVKLPAAAWGEKDGTTTNSERRISRQRPFLKAPGDARPDWWIICEVAKRMGFAAAFTYDSPAEIFAEHAALSGFENDGTRAFDIGGLAGLARKDFDWLEPVQWPQPKSRHCGETRFYGAGGFHTADGKACIVPVSPDPVRQTGGEFPFVLNTGRVRDHWHTMTRTGVSPRLSQHIAEPFAEIHSDDAARLGIADADIVCVRSSRGEILVRALLSSRQSQGAVFVPMHWTDQFASAARVDRLIPAHADPHSGQPALKHVHASIARFPVAQFGFAIVAQRPRALAADYWALARCEGGWRIELAFADGVRDWPAFAAALFGAPPEAETVAYHDLGGGRRGFACFDRTRLVGALFLASVPVAVSRQWACEQLVADHETQRARMAVIAGRPGADRADRGAIVCSCFGVGAKEIAAAAAEGCGTVEAVGNVLRAGTNCGSCRGEITRIIKRDHVQVTDHDADGVRAG